MRRALIPARGGSQRVPRKNVRPFLGVPTIGRVITALRESECFDDIVVSTDDDEIAAVAVEYGAVVPFRRSADLADSHTGARAVIRHAVEELSLADDDTLAVAYATAVLLQPHDIRESAALLTPEVDFVVAVAEYPAPIQRALGIDAAGFVDEVFGEHTTARSQDIAASYYDVGQLYWGTARAWRSDSAVVRARTRGYVMPASRVVDIDTPADWEHAERLYRAVHGG